MSDPVVFDWKVSVPAAEEPLTLAEVKAHLEIGSSDTDAEVQTMITVARQYVEKRIGRRLMTCTGIGYGEMFPGDNERLALPADVSNVVAVKYRTPAGVEDTMAAAKYFLFRARYLTAPEGWPRAQAVEIEFTAGLYANAAAVPDRVKSPMLVLLKNLWDNRASILAAGQLSASYPLVDAALADLALNPVS